jgi:N-methylhydantoinase B/oxoprolinase/acetone carboxylase alpha subunit
MSNTQLDPTKYEVLYNRLEQALIEAKEVIKQLSASVIVRDAGEAEGAETS